MAAAQWLLIIAFLRVGEYNDAACITARDGSVSKNNVSSNGTGSNNYGLFFESADSVKVENNTVSSNGTSDNFGIVLVASRNVSVAWNSVFSRGSAGTRSYGIVFTSTNASVIGNNSVNTSGTSNNVGRTYQREFTERVGV